MDSQEVSEGIRTTTTTTTEEKSNLALTILRWSLALLCPILCFFTLSFLVGFVVVFVANSSVSNPISVPSQCKIVSSVKEFSWFNQKEIITTNLLAGTIRGVDLRSSKVCELGLFNYKAKQVTYPFGKSKFRCHYDYYWASVFKVEYHDQSSGHTRLALAEAPNEALPHNCRPNFGAAWLTKDKFKVNETYDCWYTSGIAKVSLYHDGLFSCQAEDPSTFEMIRRYLILSTKILHSWFLSEEKFKYLRWEMMAGVVTGFSTSLICVVFVRLVQENVSAFSLFGAVRLLRQALHTVRFKRACFLVAYLTFTGWLAVQYGKRIGIVEIFTAFLN